MAYIIYFGFYWVHSYEIKLYLAVLTTLAMSAIHFSMMKQVDFIYDPKAPLVEPLLDLSIVSSNFLTRLVTTLSFGSIALLRECSEVWVGRTFAYLKQAE